MELNEIKVDGKTYQIRTYQPKPGVTKFEYYDGTDWRGLQLEVTPRLDKDLKAINGIDVETELYHIMINEISLEISKRNNGERWRNANE